MSSFNIQRKHLNQLSSSMINFFWGQDSNNRKLHLLRKSYLTKPKHLGGLGIRCPSLMNQALLSKQVWRIIDSPHTIYSQSINNKYLVQNTDLMVRKTSLDFVCWSAWAKNMDLIVNSLSWNISTGEDIDLSSKFWAYPLDCSRNTFKVCELIDKDTTLGITLNWDIYFVSKGYNMFYNMNRDSLNHSPNIIGPSSGN